MKRSLYFLTPSVPEIPNPTLQPVQPSIIPLGSHPCYWLIPCHMGYCAALCPGALFLVPFLTNHDLNPYLWMRDLVFGDSSSISCFVIAAQVCLWSRSFIFLLREIGLVSRFETLDKHQTFWYIYTLYAS